jgi:hypothetical protein
MLKPRVHRARVNLIGPSKLANPPKSLKSWLLDDLALPVIDGNESMHWTANFVKSVWIAHANNASPRL